MVPSNITVNTGDSVRFQCQVDGTGPLTVEWNRAGGQDLPEGVSQSGNDLVIGDADSSHAGSYTCLVRNQAGEAEDTAVLNVRCESN